MFTRGTFLYSIFVGKIPTSSLVSTLCQQKLALLPVPGLVSSVISNVVLTKPKAYLLIQKHATSAGKK